MRVNASAPIFAVTRLLLAAVLAIALSAVGVAGAERAWAQGEPECADDASACAPAENYPGPFVNVPTEPSTPGNTSLTPPSPVVSPVQVAPVAVPAADVAAATAAAADDSLDLAHSGTESYVLAYLGTGMLAFGLVSLGLRRSSRVFAD